ncbi:MAG: YlxR family protein [Actinobacteria bacterium]|nr:YlxR family protein [Actinomycetota bacterium]
MGLQAEPERTCVACRGRAPRRELLRLAGSAAGVVVDPAGREPGRGAYLHRDPACVEAAFRKGSLARALKRGLTPEEAARLRIHIGRELG